jgi:hypothetical protein
MGKWPTHGMSYQREYGVWATMINRCHNPRVRSYADYGARGIAVCERWRSSFVAFFADMGQRPSAKHSIDRIDNNRGYEPGNCRWATRTEQSRNTRSSRLTESDVIDIRTLSGLIGPGYSVLGRAFDISPQLARAVVVRRLWKDIP